MTWWEQVCVGLCVCATDLAWGHSCPYLLLMVSTVVFFRTPSQKERPALPYVVWDCWSCTGYHNGNRVGFFVSSLFFRVQYTLFVRQPWWAWLLGFSIDCLGVCSVRHHESSCSERVEEHFANIYIGNKDWRYTYSGMVNSPWRATLVRIKRCSNSCFSLLLKCPAPGACDICSLRQYFSVLKGPEVEPPYSLDCDQNLTLSLS